MALVIPPNYQAVAWELVLEGDPEPMYITAGLETPAVTPSVTLANELLALCEDTLDRFLCDVYSITRVILRDDTFFAESTGPAIPGFNAGVPSPQNCSTLVKKLTGLLGRENQGRFFVPGIESTAVTSAGSILDATVTELQTRISSWGGAIVGATGVDAVVILHTDALSTPTTVGSFRVEAKIATQRRRLRP